MAETGDIERDLQAIATELRRLEGEYNMYFAGRVPRPPVETRARVETQLKKLERTYIDNLALRFRLNTLQARFTSFTELWDRGLRAREEGRPGPFSRKPVVLPQERPTAPAAPEGLPDRVVHVASFTDASRENDKLRELYDSLADARRQTGEDPVPFHRFADLVRDQVSTLRQSGIGEVALRVSVKDGKVSLTARAMKGTRG
jgi:hypothetical protein